MSTIPRVIPRDEPVAAKVSRIVECRIVKGRCVTHQRPDDTRPACPFVNELLRHAVHGVRPNEDRGLLPPAAGAA